MIPLCVHIRIQWNVVCEGKVMAYKGRYTTHNLNLRTLLGQNIAIHGHLSILDKFMVFICLGNHQRTVETSNSPHTEHNMEFMLAFEGYPDG